MQFRDRPEYAYISTIRRDGQARITPKLIYVRRLASATSRRAHVRGRPAPAESILLSRSGRCFGRVAMLPKGKATYGRMAGRTECARAGLLVFDGWLTWPGTLLCRVRPECWDASRLLIDRSVRWLVGFVLHVHGDEAQHWAGEDAEDKAVYRRNMTHVRCVHRRSEK